MLDEPSIGLHPSNIVGLNAVMHDLIADGNSIILVDHDTQILSEADWLIEMGPEAGAGGGYVITQGTIPTGNRKKESMIGPFLAQTADMRIRKPIALGGNICTGKASFVHRCHPYGKTSGNRHSQRKTYGRYRCLRLR